MAFLDGLFGKRERRERRPRRDRPPSAEPTTVPPAWESLSDEDPGPVAPSPTPPANEAQGWDQPSPPPPVAPPSRLAPPEPDRSSAGVFTGRSGMPTEVEVRRVNQYMEKQMGFVPDMFRVMNTVVTEPGKTYADFYNSLWQDGALSRKHKELMAMAIGIAYCAPSSIEHTIPAVKAGATIPEVFEAASIGMMSAGFVPNGPGISQAFECGAKCLDAADKYRKGQPIE